MSITDRKPDRRITLAAISLSLLGAWISGELLRQHADIWDARGSSPGILARLCSAAGTPAINCDAALRSRWAEVAIPTPMFETGHGLSLRWPRIPIAFLGLSYFVFLLSWFCQVGPAYTAVSRWAVLPRALMTCGGLASCALLSIMAIGFSPWCLGCAAVHAINLLLCLMILGPWRRTPLGDASDAAVNRLQALPARTGLYPGTAPRAVGLALLLIIGLGIHYRDHVAFAAKLDELQTYRQLVESMKSDPEFLLREHFAQPRYDIPARMTEQIAGTPRLVVFTDYECPACRCTAKSLERNVAEAFDGRLTVHLRHFPLCKGCNEHVRQSLHPQACDAARAAEAARRLGGEEAFRQISSLLFHHRGPLSEAAYREAAAGIGIDPDRLLREMDAPEVRGIILDDVALARRLGVSSTPTMFLDGRRITELCETPAFWKAVALRTARSSEARMASGETGRDDDPCARGEE